MSKRETQKMFDRLIKKGFHALIIKDKGQTTVQPLTRKGYEAIYTICANAGMPEELLKRLSEKAARALSGGRAA